MIRFMKVKNKQAFILRHDMNFKHLLINTGIFGTINNNKVIKKNKRLYNYHSKLTISCGAFNTTGDS